MLNIKHIELSEANAFVAAYHRHHEPVTGHRFSLGVYDANKLCGVAIVGRPVARKINQHTIVEVTRLCTDGTRNACSILYGACARAAKALGYERIITYILCSENGASLRASGWTCVSKKCGGKQWTGERVPKQTPLRPLEYKKRFERELI